MSCEMGHIPWLVSMVKTTSVAGRTPGLRGAARLGTVPVGCRLGSTPPSSAVGGGKADGHA